MGMGIGNGQGDVHHPSLFLSMGSDIGGIRGSYTMGTLAKLEESGIPVLDPLSLQLLAMTQ